MTKEQVIEYFGGVVEVADALGISHQAVSKWAEVPLDRQLKIEQLSKGKLKIRRKDNAKNV